MRCSFLTAAAVLSSLASSSAFGAFTFTATATDLAGPNQSVLIRAINDGVGGSGTKVAAIDAHVQLFGGAKAFFLVGDLDDDGTPDTVDFPNNANNSNFGYVRIGTASNTFIASSVPSIAYTQPNPYSAGVNQFSVAATTTGTQPLATGAGAAVLRLVIPDGASGVLTGQIAGDTGPAFTIVPFAILPEPTTVGLASLAGLAMIRRRK